MFRMYFLLCKVKHISGMDNCKAIVSKAKYLITSSLPMQQLTIKTFVQGIKMTYRVMFIALE